MHVMRLIATSISGTKSLLFTHHFWREIRTIKVLTLLLEEIRTVAPNVKKETKTLTQMFEKVVYPLDLTLQDVYEPFHSCNSH